MGASYALAVRSVNWPDLKGLAQRRGFDWGLAAACGVVTGLSYPPVSMHFMAWFALVPVIFLAGRNNSWRRAFLLAATTFWACYAVAFSWVLNHEMPSAAAALISPLVILPMVHAAPFGMAVVAGRRFGRVAFHGALLAGWFLCEVVLSNGPFALPWGILANTQADALVMAQVAGVVGAGGLSLLVLLANQLGAIAVEVNRLRLPAAVALVGLLGSIYLYGNFQLRRPAPPATQLNIGMVQPAIPASEWAAPDPVRTITTLLELSEPLAARKPDVIVWPETAVRADLAPEIIATIQRWVDARNVPVLTGAVLTKHDGYTNSALLFTPRGTTRRYDKVRLVPMAEYVPYTDRVPFLKKLTVSAGGVSGYIPGTDVTPLSLGSNRIAPLICFESLFSSHARAFTRNGADLLFVLSQDGWWGRTFGFRQHFAYNRLRAIETRRPVVQVAVSGISGAFLPDGRVLAQTKWMERRAMILRVPVSTSDKHDDLSTQ